MPRRFSKALLAGLALLLVTSAATTSAPAAAGPVLRTSAKLTECATGATPDERYARYSALMRVVAGTDRMGVRFDLYARADDDEPFHRVDAPRLGTWSYSTADIYRKGLQVTNLAPATYRATVSFRWLDADGHVIASSKRRTETCTEPDARPKLAVGALDFAKVGDPAQLRYIVNVRNDGKSEAGPFDVALSIDGVAQTPVTVIGLAAGATQAVPFVGPRCKGGADIVIAVDPSKRIDEADRADNTKTAGCPVQI